MPIELYMLDKLKERIQLAREIDTVQHRAKKEKHERNWLKEAAEAMEIVLDSDLARCAQIAFLLHPDLMCNVSSDDDDDTASGPSKHQRKAAGAKTAALKAELKALLAQPLVARGVSTRYITSGVRSIADDFIAGECTWLLLRSRLAPGTPAH